MLLFHVQSFRKLTHVSIEKVIIERKVLRVTLGILRFIWSNFNYLYFIIVFGILGTEIVILDDFLRAFGGVPSPFAPRDGDVVSNVIRSCTHVVLQFPWGEGD